MFSTEIFAAIIGGTIALVVMVASQILTGISRERERLQDGRKNFEDRPRDIRLRAYTLYEELSCPTDIVKTQIKTADVVLWAERYAEEARALGIEARVGWFAKVSKMLRKEQDRIRQTTDEDLVEFGRLPLGLACDL